MYWERSPRERAIAAARERHEARLAIAVSAAAKRVQDLPLGHVAQLVAELSEYVLAKYREDLDAIEKQHPEPATDAATIAPAEPSDHVTPSEDAPRTIAAMTLPLLTRFGDALLSSARLRVEILTNGAVSLYDDAASDDDPVQTVDAFKLGRVLDELKAQYRRSEPR